MSKKNICVLFGGRSSEYEVSLSSAYAVLSHINKDKYNVIKIGITKTEGAWYLFKGSDEAVKDGSWKDSVRESDRVFVNPALGGGLFREIEDSRISVPCDMIFPVLHGACGEDGTVQGMLELCGVPFAGCGCTSSGLCMDKAMTKIIVSSLGIRQADCEIVLKRDFEKNADEIIKNAERLGYPVFVKPSRAGSSVGVSKARDREELKKAFAAAFNEDNKVLCEQAIRGKEIEVAVLEENGRYTVSVPGEIDPGSDFYDYETKYISDAASYHIPARVSADTQDALQKAAEDIFRAMDCRGLARVDFFVTDDGGAVFNEINTLPGFTPISMYPKLMAHSGITFSELIDRLIGR